MAKPYVLEVELTIDEGAMDEFMRLVLENATHSRTEPGCLRFDVLRPDDAPNSVVLYEIYVDEGGYNAHRQTAHYAKFDAGRKPIVKATKRRTYSWSNPT
ncbi:MAG: antibiotic biosynthesis monooxygenase [Candidatus Eremiobacteraeota bacterium]|nr:antibiotic biosynthesis monooxygenase [Candidatus Eremiobacteraeota bacterium]